MLIATWAQFAGLQRQKSLPKLPTHWDRRLNVKFQSEFLLLLCRVEVDHHVIQVEVVGNNYYVSLFKKALEIQGYITDILRKCKEKVGAP